MSPKVAKLLLEINECLNNLRLWKIRTSYVFLYHIFNFPLV